MKKIYCISGLGDIHGTADRITPAKLVHPDRWIEGASHIMIYNRAAEVGKIISDFLAL